MSPEVVALLRLSSESLDAAEAMLQIGYPRFSVSRAYYTMLYAAEALHLAEGRSYSKHGAVIAGFGRHFVKTGLLPSDLHKRFRRAFQDRQVCDYDALHAVSIETAQANITHAREFLHAARTFLQSGETA